MLKRMFVLFLLVITFVGCDSSKTETTTTTYHTITLLNSYNDTSKSLDDVPFGEIIELPVDDIENKTFVGWRSGENYYLGDYLVETDITLEAEYEDTKDIFEYTIIPETGQISIDRYIGSAKYLRVPQQIDNQYVGVLSRNVFTETDVVEVELPKTITMIQSAFNNVPYLEKVSFYGEYAGYNYKPFSPNQYEAIITEYSDVCQIVEDNDTSWKFSAGCPISEVLEIFDFYIPGVGNVQTYRTNVDLNLYDDGSTDIIFSQLAFNDVPNLTTIEFPERFKSFFPDMIYKAPNLLNLVFDGNDKYQVIDNVVYATIEPTQENPEVQYEMIYYPPALTDKEFTVPDFVNSINGMIFYGFNPHLEVINLGPNIKTIGDEFFLYISNLKEVNVVENDGSFYSIDGVLYKDDILVVYPKHKPGTSFTVPENVREIAPFAFFRQIYLEELILNDKLEKIDIYAFAETTLIKEINIPSSVISIGSNFIINSAIDIIIINRSSVIDGSITNIGSSNYKRDGSFYIPDDSYDDYLQNSNWDDISSIVHRQSEYIE